MRAQGPDAAPQPDIGAGGDPTPFVRPSDISGAARRRPDIAELLAVERAAAAVVEPVARLWRELASAADATVSSHALDALLRSSLSTMGRLLSVNTVAILLANDAGDELVARAAIGLPEELTLGLGIRAGQGVSGRVLATCRPLVVPDLSAVEVVNPVLRDSGLRSVAAVPLQCENHPIGVMYAASYEVHRFGQADTDLLQMVADRLAAALDRVRLFGRERTARHDAERLADRVGRLQRATALLSGAESRSAAADAVIEALSAPGTWCGVWLPDEDHLVPVHTEGAPLKWDAPVELSSRAPLAAAARAHRAAYAVSDEETGASNRTGDGDGDVTRTGDGGPDGTSSAILPIVHDGRTLAVVALVRRGGAGWAQDERDLLGTVVGQAAQALDRIRLGAAERRSADHARFFARAAQVLAEAATLPDTLDRLGDLAVRALGEICLIDIIGEDGDLVRMVAKHRDLNAQPLVDRLRSEFAPDPSGRHPAITAILTGRSSWARAMTDEFLRATTVSGAHFELTKALGFRAYVSVPIVAGTKVLGSLTSVSLSRTFDPEEVVFAEQLAQQVAAVVDNARRYDTAYRTSQILQSSLLPTSMPEVPGLDVETRYLTATRALEVGGDFYDLLVLPSGTVLCVIGDVAGHDRAAAAQMGHLRSAVRALAGQVASPAELVDSLRWSWDLLGFDRIATVLLAAVSVETGRVQLTSAGHYPPVLLWDGSARFPEVPTSPPLGVPSHLERNRRPAGQWEGRLHPGEILLCYTDGFIDERGVGPAASMAHLAHVAASGPRTPRDVCDRVVGILDAGRADDAALLGVALVADDTAVAAP